MSTATSRSVLQRQTDHRRCHSRTLERAAAPASLEIVEIGSKFRPEVLPDFAGTEFDKTGSRRCEFSGRACGQAIALLRFRRKSKHFIQPLARQSCDRP